MITSRPGRAIATRSPPFPRSRRPSRPPQLGSTDISAASGLDTAAVLAVASGAPVDTGLVALGVPAPDGRGAAGRSTRTMTLADRPRRARAGARARLPRAAADARRLRGARRALGRGHGAAAAAARAPRARRAAAHAARGGRAAGRGRDDQAAAAHARRLSARGRRDEPRRRAAPSASRRSRAARWPARSARRAAWASAATSTPEEISEQLLRLARLLRDEQDARVSNVVMMGMGEPFHNYDNVLAAIRTINAPEAFGLGARQIAISTAGWIPGHRPARRGAAADQARALAARARRRAAHASSCRSRSATRSPS